MRRVIQHILMYSVSYTRHHDRLSPLSFSLSDFDTLISHRPPLHIYIPSSLVIPRGLVSQLLFVFYLVICYVSVIHGGSSWIKWTGPAL